TIRTMCGNMEYLQCNAPQRLELADGRMIWLRHGSKSTQCTFTPTDNSDLQKMPAGQVVWSRELMGAGTVITDNSKKIMDAITAHNASFAAEQMMMPIPPNSGTAGSVGSPDGGMMTGAAGAGGVTGNAGAGG